MSLVQDVVEAMGLPMIAPINDHRPFYEVLREWMTRNGLTYTGASERLDLARGSVGNALEGKPVRQERALRALMTLVDEGRA